jgi:hypothetical protein
MATAVILMPVMMAFLAMAGASAFGKPKPSAAQYQYKMTICHQTGSDTNPEVTITVSANAVAKHVNNHGDTLGPCPTAPVLTSSAADAGDGEGNGKGKGQGNGQGQGNSQGQGNGKGKNK